MTLEAALYGRYLGFSVTVFETDAAVHAIRENPTLPAPKSFSTPLGLAALAAQRGLGTTMIELEVETFEDWLTHYLSRLITSDLLKNCLQEFVQVTAIAFADDDPEMDDEEDELGGDTEEGDVPPDFELTWLNADRAQQSSRFEAIIDMRPMELGERAAWLGPGSNSDGSPPDYYLVLADVTADAIDDAKLTEARASLRQLFADLCGRPQLDVYRTLGGEV